MSESPTVGELFKVDAVTDDQLSAAVEVYFTDLYAGAFPINDGYVIDLDAAVAAHPWASLVVANEETSPCLKRGIVRMAIMQARVQKA